jgi:hypothetical protein
MHVSLDSALGRQRRLNQIGESITQIAPDPAAAYSLRSLTGSDPKVVRVRRGSDNDERDFTASEVSSGALTTYVNAQVTAPLDIQALTSTGRDGDFLIAKAAYSLRSLGTRQATVTSSGDTAGDTSGKYVCQVRRNVNGDLKSFTADEVSDGTLLSFVNESFTSSLPLDVAGSAAAAYGLRNLSSSYTGNVVEVRRSSDDTTQNFTAAEVTDGTLLAFVNNSSVATVNTQDFTDGSSWSETGSGSARFTTNSVTGGTGPRQVLSTYQFKAGTTYKITLDGNPNALNTAQCGVHLNRVSDNALTALVSNRTVAFNLDTTFTPSDDSNLRIRTGLGTADWTYSNFTVQVVTSDGHVKTWYDQSGNSKNATQTTAANQPKIVSSGALVTDGGLLFDGDTTFLDTGSSLSLGTEFFVTSVLNINTPVDANGSIIGNSANGGDDRLFITTANDKLSIRNGGVNIESSLVASKTQDNLTTYQAASSSFTFVLDGTTDAKSALSTGQSFRYIGGGTGFNLSANMKELIIYDTDQTDKRRAIEESIATANGITLASFNRDGFVSTWYDQSVSDQAGNTPTGNHATQTTAGSQPKIVSAGALETDGMDFDGTDDEFDIPNDLISNVNSVSAFLVSKSDVITSGVPLALSDNSPNDARWYLAQIISNNFNLGYQDSNEKIVIASADTSVHLFSATSGTVTTEAFIDGTSGGTTSSISSFSPLSSGGIGSVNGFGPFNGHIREVIVYNSDQTDNRVAIEANIGEHYSIDLPSGVDPGFDQVDGFVETWYDQSGNSLDAVQATASKQPLIVESGSLNVDSFSNPTIRFEKDSETHLITTDQTLDPNLEVSAFVVQKDEQVLNRNSAWVAMRRSDSSSRHSAFEMAVNNNSIKFRVIYDPLGDNTNRDDISVTVASDGLGTTSIMSGIKTSSGDLDGFFNGSSVIDTTVTDNTDLGNSYGITMGKHTNSGQFADGRLNEVIFYLSDQTANRSAIETNLANHYGITLL